MHGGLPLESPLESTVCTLCGPLYRVSTTDDCTACAKALREKCAGTVWQLRFVPQQTKRSQSGANYVWIMCYECVMCTFQWSALCLGIRSLSRFGGCLQLFLSVPIYFYGFLFRWISYVDFKVFLSVSSQSPAILWPSDSYKKVRSKKVSAESGPMAKRRSKILTLIRMTLVRSSIKFVLP